MPEREENTTAFTPDVRAEAAGAGAAQGTDPAATDRQAQRPDATPLEQAQTEIAALKDRNLRLMAEAQNASKRAARERDEAVRFAEFGFARELLVVIDDCERTLESAKDKPGAQALAEGVRIIYEHFVKVLAQRGIKQIEAVGKPFDPAVHEALLQQPSKEQAAGTVMQELARGYTMYERTLRPARVIVSTGPA